jgi:hypothetical protein
VTAGCNVGRASLNVLIYAGRGRNGFAADEGRPRVC